ncbi:glycosyltransferase [Candidatus Bathyarchaeota archaeon]|nr:MAG: glycosyltransferase [Candidatus Bathyarchaeota archaeon]
MVEYEEPGQNPDRRRQRFNRLSGNHARSGRSPSPARHRLRRRRLQRRERLMTSLLLIVWLIVGGVHIGAPLIYFGLMRRVGAKRDYNIEQKPIEPDVSVIIPTYNEAPVIAKKIANLLENNYPLDKLEVIITDGGSKDGTVEIARELLERRSVRARILTQRERRGKSYGVNVALSAAKNEIICLSDAECMWEKGALHNALKYISDPSIGSVTGIHALSGSAEGLSLSIEGSYRSIYRMLRVAESKLHSTPIAEAEIQVFRYSDVKKVDPRVGADDTCIALCVVEKGLRAIAAEDVMFFDPTPGSWTGRFRQKFRRGQHILQAFLKHSRLIFRRRDIFSSVIFPMEFFIYVINPLLFPLFLVLTVTLMATNLLLALLIAGALAVVAAVPGLRTAFTTYLTNNLTMLAAIIQEARGNKQLVWTKIDETRVSPETAEPPVIPS